MNSNSNPAPSLTFPTPSKSNMGRENSTASSSQFVSGFQVSGASTVLLNLETGFFFSLLLLLNLNLWAGSFVSSLIFLPEAVSRGEWWRLWTHPFVHVSWYHWFLDGSTFLILYRQLPSRSISERLWIVAFSGAGSLGVAWALEPNIDSGGLCGLSGICHGLMAFISVQWALAQPSQSIQNGFRGSVSPRILGLTGLILLSGKIGFECLANEALFSGLHFGPVGKPVPSCHLGGFLGGVISSGVVRLGSLCAKNFPNALGIGSE